MNPWQIVRQLKNLLEDQTWPDGAAGPVFGDVIVSAGPNERGVGQLRFPFVLLAPADAEVDAEKPALLLQRFNARIVARVANDPFGEAVLIGGARSGGQGSSDGRGVMELEEELLKAVSDLDATNGIFLRERWRGAVEAIEDEELGYVATREYRLEAWCTVERHYPQPLRLSATDATGGDANLAWQIPPDRYDYHELILRRAAGATPPSSVTDGTGVTVASKTTTSLTDSPGAGQFSYALFAGYDEIGAGASDRYSIAATATVTVT